MLHIAHDAIEITTTAGAADFACVCDPEYFIEAAKDVPGEELCRIIAASIKTAGGFDRS